VGLNCYRLEGDGGHEKGHLQRLNQGVFAYFFMRQPYARDVCIPTPADPDKKFQQLSTPSRLIASWQSVVKSKSLCARKPGVKSGDIDVSEKIVTGKFGFP
jgi:hypothetical protein